MKINLSQAPEKITNSSFGVEVGNVYKNQKGSIYIIASIIDRGFSTGSNATAFVVNQDGYITNVVNYSTYYFSRFTCLGKAINLPEEIEIEWMI